MNRPTILAVETLLLISPYLIDTGRFLDAYTLFGTTIRVAQALGRKYALRANLIIGFFLLLTFNSAPRSLSIATQAV